ncbi:Zn-dependent hydrolase [Halovalidus salilacus]|uniref:Zn-dependent hydrolase n=1 Tax=Halovalidus salilacus TaxID=3075124 RepID=UPI00361ECE6C
MEIDQRRLRDDLETTASFGAIDADDGHGRTVLTGTEADQQARDYLCERLQEAGLEVRIDAVGTIVGRWTPASAEPDAAPIAAGSHLDSVPAGGIFDGPLGVYAALEAVRTLQETERALDRPIEVVSFTEEEGTRFGALLGSSVAVGERSPATALERTAADGTTLEDALIEIGYHGDATIDAAAWDAWLELHIEQGRRLERAGTPVGIVSAITGILHLDVRIDGEANHAGTTPMAYRTDPPAAAELVLAVEDAATDLLAESDSVVGTVGRLEVTPNATNVVPGTTRLGIDIRDVTAATMTAVRQRVEETLARLERERGVETTLRETVAIDPVPMASRCQEALHRSAEHTGIDAPTLHSGAGHDSMHVAAVTDAGMLFAPSKAGLSHSPAEWTDWDDCAQATAVLATALADLATGSPAD